MPTQRRDHAADNAKGITPANVSLGRHGKVSWLCKHGPYEQEIRVRVRGHGCNQCADEVSAQRSRESYNARRREQRAEATRIKASQQSNSGMVLLFSREAPEPEAG